MPVFEITRVETIYQHLFVEADTKEEAAYIATETDEGRDSGKYNSEMQEPEEIDPKETHGKYVETENGSYLIGIDTKPVE